MAGTSIFYFQKHCIHCYLIFNRKAHLFGKYSNFPFFLILNSVFSLYNKAALLQNLQGQ